MIKVLSITSLVFVIVILVLTIVSIKKIDFDFDDTFNQLFRSNSRRLESNNVQRYLKTNTFVESQFTPFFFEYNIERHLEKAKRSGYAALLVEILDLLNRILIFATLLGASKNKYSTLTFLILSTIDCILYNIVIGLKYNLVHFKTDIPEEVNDFTDSKYDVMKDMYDDVKIAKRLLISILVFSSVTGLLNFIQIFFALFNDPQNEKVEEDNNQDNKNKELN